MLCSPVTALPSVGLEPCGVFPHSARFAFLFSAAIKLQHVGPFVKRLWPMLGLLKAIFIASLVPCVASCCRQTRVLANAAQLMRQPGERIPTLLVKLGDVLAFGHLDGMHPAGQRPQPRR